MGVGGGGANKQSLCEVPAERVEAAALQLWLPDCAFRWRTPMGLRCINDSPDLRFRSPLRLFSLSPSSPTQSIIPVTEVQIIEKKRLLKRRSWATRAGDHGTGMLAMVEREPVCVRARGAAAKETRSDASSMIIALIRKRFMCRSLKNSGPKMIPVFRGPVRGTGPVRTPST